MHAARSADFCQLLLRVPFVSMVLSAAQVAKRAFVRILRWRTSRSIKGRVDLSRNRFNRFNVYNKSTRFNPSSRLHKAPEAGTTDLTGARVLLHDMAFSYTGHLLKITWVR